MTQNDILILAKAGFTAQQIAALSATAPAASAAPTASVAPTAQAAQAAPTAQAAPLTYDQFQHELQKMALLGAHQSGKVETADSVLASIINPPASTEGGKINGGK